ncbi:MAG TPA: NDP-sugar synthase [Vicinamibacterales bacterium]|nr:NDP-sugar synthase [Vicinamibacterales bacterium]
MNSASGIRRAGIIAAGHGERLRPGGHPLKPLVPINGRTLVERVLASISETHPDEVVIIVNETSRAVQDHVNGERWPFSIRWIVETTPSSMHSFLRVVEALAHSDAAGPFLVSTVDTVAAPGTYATFVTASQLLDADVVLAVAPVTDDEKPLMVRTLPGSPRVAAIGAAAADASWATAGYYCVRPTVLREGDAARRAGVAALRAFFGRLHARGYAFAAVPVSGGVDVDRPADVSAAERYLRQVGA